MYDVPYRQNTPIDGVEKIEKIQNQIMENIRRLSEVSVYYLNSHNSDQQIQALTK